MHVTNHAMIEAWRRFRKAVLLYFASAFPTLADPCRTLASRISLCSRCALHAECFVSILSVRFRTRSHRPCPTPSIKFSSDCRAALSQGTQVPPVASSCANTPNAPVPTRPSWPRISARTRPTNRKILYKDPDLKGPFCILAHVYRGEKNSNPHDHGPSWAVYGQVAGVDPPITRSAAVGEAGEQGARQGRKGAHLRAHARHRPRLQRRRAAFAAPRGRHPPDPHRGPGPQPR